MSALPSRTASRIVSPRFQKLHFQTPHSPVSVLPLRFKRAAKNPGPAFRPDRGPDRPSYFHFRSEEHTSELQSRENLVCRLLLEKKNVSQATRHILDG